MTTAGGFFRPPVPSEYRSSGALLHVASPPSPDGILIEDGLLRASDCEGKSFSAAPLITTPSSRSSALGRCSSYRIPLVY
jgi:hypothetical protein